MSAPPQSAPTVAASFAVATTDPAVAAHALERAAASSKRPAGALVFASGALAERLEATFGEVRRALGEVPFALATGSGVLSERGESEGASALSGVVFGGATAAPVLVPSSTPVERLGAATAEAALRAVGDGSGTVVLFASPNGFDPRALERLSSDAPRATIVGAGTAKAGAAVASAGGALGRGPVVGLAIRGLGRPAVRTSSACRRLTPFERITEVRGGLVAKIGDRAALDVLSEAARDLPGQPLVLAILAEGDDEPRPGHGGVAVRGIRGVDPTERAIAVGPEAVHGARIAFAVRDGAASRTDLESAAREVAREVAGGAPRFGLYLSCAGRGAGLYGAPDVDTRILRARFPNVPMAGMFSSFELGPFAGRTSMHLYTGVLALFASPS